MAWSIGYDEAWLRDVGYAVPAWCDHPDCDNEIHRGLAHVCGGELYGGVNGCGLFFCEDHRDGDCLCERCADKKESFPGKFVEHPDWISHKLNDATWQQWRAENPERVKQLKTQLSQYKEHQNRCSEGDC